MALSALCNCPSKRYNDLAELIASRSNIFARTSEQMRVFSARKGQASVGLLWRSFVSSKRTNRIDK